MVFYGPLVTPTSISGGDGGSGMTGTAVGKRKRTKKQARPPGSSSKKKNKSASSVVVSTAREASAPLGPASPAVAAATAFQRPPDDAGGVTEAQAHRHEMVAASRKSNRANAGNRYQAPSTSTATAAAATGQKRKRAAATSTTPSERAVMKAALESEEIKEILNSYTREGQREAKKLIKAGARAAVEAAAALALSSSSAPAQSQSQSSARNQKARQKRAGTAGTAEEAVAATRGGDDRTGATAAATGTSGDQQHDGRKRRKAGKKASTAAATAATGSTRGARSSSVVRARKKGGTRATTAAADADAVGRRQQQQTQKEVRCIVQIRRNPTTNSFGLTLLDESFVPSSSSAEKGATTAAACGGTKISITSVLPSLGDSFLLRTPSWNPALRPRPGDVVVCVNNTPVSGPGWTLAKVCEEIGRTVGPTLFLGVVRATEAAAPGGGAAAPVPAPVPAPAPAIGPLTVARNDGAPSPASAPSTCPTRSADRNSAGTPTSVSVPPAVLSAPAPVLPPVASVVSDDPPDSGGDKPALVERLHEPRDHMKQNGSALPSERYPSYQRCNWLTWSGPIRDDCNKAEGGQSRHASYGYFSCAGCGKTGANQSLCLRFKFKGTFACIPRKCGLKDFVVSKGRLSHLLGNVSASERDSVARHCECIPDSRFGSGVAGYYLVDEVLAKGKDLLEQGLLEGKVKKYFDRK